MWTTSRSPCSARWGFGALAWPCWPLRAPPAWSLNSTIAAAGPQHARPVRSPSLLDFSCGSDGAGTE
eukprot:8126665-Alexandrium_andersonii.AAC.1